MILLFLFDKYLSGGGVRRSFFFFGVAIWGGG